MTLCIHCRRMKLDIVPAKYLSLPEMFRNGITKERSNGTTISDPLDSLVTYRSHVRDKNSNFGVSTEIIFRYIFEILKAPCKIK